MLSLPHAIGPSGCPNRRFEKVVRMKITYRNIEPSYQSLIENDFAHHVEKLNRLLKRYAPDLVQLHSCLEKTPRKSEFRFSLNLTLPTGTLHATGLGADVRTSVKAAFAEIEVQVKKHQQKLRKDYSWKRKRGRARPTFEPEGASASN
jgi:ribosomal subunit interface protein